MNYEKFKVGFYSQKNGFKKKINKLSIKQKGELLLSATEDKDLKLIKYLVEDLGTPIGYANKNGTNSLMVLAQNIYARNDLFKIDRDLDYKIAKYFLERMTDDEINAQDKRGFTYAQGLYPYSFPLLNAFNANIQKISQVSALMYLCAHLCNQIEIELENPYIENGVYRKYETIIDTRVVDLIYLFRAYGAQTDLKDSNGLDCLKYAIAFNNLDAAKSCTAFIKPFKNIISIPADVNAQDNYGNTSYHHACSRHKVEGFLELLEDNGADPNILNNNNQTPVDVSSPVWARDHVKEYAKAFNEKLLAANGQQSTENDEHPEFNLYLITPTKEIEK